MRQVIEISAQDKLKKFVDATGPDGKKLNERAIRAVEYWDRLNSQEKQKAWFEWKRFYEECRLSEPAKVFDTMVQANKAGDSRTFWDLIGHMKSLRKTYVPLPKPNTIDPYWLEADQACWSYRKLIKAAQEEPMGYRGSSDINDIFEGGTT